MTDLERLLTEAACRDLVLASATAVDARDFAALAALFAVDGELVRPGGQVAKGRAAIEQAYANRDPDRLTRHLISNHRVRPINARQAVSWCSVLLWSGRHSEASGPQGRVADAAQLLGEFDDQLTLTVEGWRIQRRVASFSLHRPAA